MSLLLLLAHCCHVIWLSLTQHTHTHHPQEMNNAPDLMDDTFLLASRAAAYAPRMLLHESLLPPLLDTATVRSVAAAAAVFCRLCWVIGHCAGSCLGDALPLSSSSCCHHHCITSPMYTYVCVCVCVYVAPDPSCIMCCCCCCRTGGCAGAAP